jgi:hypothetical protein
MAKYSKASQKKVEESMHEMHEGKLKSGRSGKKVTNPKQAIAIGLSEARAEGDKAPKKSASASKKTDSKKATPKKEASKKAAPKKTASKKAAPKKSETKSKSSSSKPGPKKGSSKK